MRIFLIAASLLLVATYISPASARWGCGSQAYPGGHYRTFGFDTKEHAGAVVLELCRKGHNDCRIVGCNSNIDNEAQANELWPLTAGNPVHCGAGSNVKC
jgi:hypothetical protein